MNIAKLILGVTILYTMLAMYMKLEELIEIVGGQIG